MCSTGTVIVFVMALYSIDIINEMNMLPKSAFTLLGHLIILS